MALDVSVSVCQSRDGGQDRAASLAIRGGELKGPLLLASDGMVAYSSARRIAECLADRSIQQPAAALAESGRLKNGSLQYDVAVIVVTSAADRHA